MRRAGQSPVLSLKNITKSFAGKKAVDAVTLTIPKGEIFGFLGPNGAGKSTTIRLILDILRPDDNGGGIEILGRSNRDTAATHKVIGYLSGDMVLDGDLTGRQYLGFINHLYGGNHAHTTAKLASILDADLNKKIGNYSRGNRQKISLIAALLHNPKLLILDEPTSGFDPLVQEKFAEIIREYVAEGGTVFMSSHVLAEVQHLCDRVAFIRDGKIIRTTRVQDLLDVAAKRVIVTANNGALKIIQKDYQTLPGLSLAETAPGRMEFSYTGNVNGLLEYLSRKTLADVTIREPELEEIFGQYYESATATAEETT